MFTGSLKNERIRFLVHGFSYCHYRPGFRHLARTRILCASKN
nr:MAG TPA: hypothetical protein [Caudoviricetes sp.]